MIKIYISSSICFIFLKSVCTTGTVKQDYSDDEKDIEDEADLNYTKNIDEQREKKMKQILSNHFQQQMQEKASLLLSGNVYMYNLYLKST